MSTPDPPPDPPAAIGAHAEPPAERWLRVVDPIDATRWEVDAGFLSSGWRCRWGQGCLGILAEPAADRNEGCCSVGAELLDDDEARRIGALGVSLDPARFQFAVAASDGGVLAGDGGTGARSTRVVDGACIFLNRPGFAGGEGCALHLAALDDGESPIDWKPSVCWQLPLAIDEQPDGTRRLRRWRRTDWHRDGDPAPDSPRSEDQVAWCCTEDRWSTDAYDGDAPVLDTMAEELTALVGAEVMVELRRRL